MTIRKRLAYATRGFRGGENVTQTLYLDGEVVLEFSQYETSVEVLKDIPLSVDISPYQEFVVEFSVLADSILVDIEPMSHEVTIEHISNSVSVESVSEIGITVQ